MALTGSIRSFGVRDVKLTPLPTGSQVDLPNAQRFSFTEALTSGTLRGDDATVAIAAYTDMVEWELEAGGISLEALKVMTGRTIAITGTTPSQKNTVLTRAGDVMPYFKLYMQAKGDGIDDIHILVYKCKLTEGLEGEWKDGEFFVQKCAGVAIDDGSKLMEIVQNETSAAVPAT
jgi:hypothetical protein